MLLVGFEDQDNLGLRYLSARLRQEGHQTRLAAFSSDPGPVVQAIGECEPDVVGFSLIFQYFVPNYAGLLRALRAAGVDCHFTIGGHYASFEPASLMEAIPELDSVVRFEGEDTLVELAERVANRSPWTELPGIAFRSPSGVVVNPARQGRRNLDELPWPDRGDIDYRSQDTPIASLLGSRGCPFRCSFCSIVAFYQGNGTRGRRFRDPVQVVDEMEDLHRRQGVRVILWQDDDFLAGGAQAARWAHAIARECIRRGLQHGLRWKISCRSDEVRPGVLEPLVEAGLVYVYLGVESGDEEDLRQMDKGFSPGVHFEAAAVLRQLDLAFDFGFMLLQPWSTVGSVRSNLHFVREFSTLGPSPVGFCRMLPYAGTAAERRLMEEGRLRKTRDARPDYAFLDSRLDRFYVWMMKTFAARNFTAEGTQNILRLLLFDASLNLPGRAVDPAYRETLWELIRISNRIAVNSAECALDHIERAAPDGSSEEFLAQLSARHEAEDGRLREDLAALLHRYSVDRPIS